MSLYVYYKNRNILFLVNFSNGMSNAKSISKFSTRVGALSTCTITQDLTKFLLFVVSHFLNLIW